MIGDLIILLSGVVVGVVVTHLFYVKLLLTKIKTKYAATSLKEAFEILLNKDIMPTIIDKADLIINPVLEKISIKIDEKTSEFTNIEGKLNDALNPITERIDERMDELDKKLDDILNAR